VNHYKSLAVFLTVFVVMPVFLFFGLRWVAQRFISTRLVSKAGVKPANIKCVALRSSAARSYVAIAICLSSAALGVIGIQRGWGNVSSIAFKVACSWFLSGSWLAGEFTREGLKRLNVPLSSVYQEAKQQRKPGKAPSLVRVMNTGGGIMVLAGIVGWFV
jgi:hypothetical protein